MIAVKKTIFLLVLMFAGTALFALSPANLFIAVRNHSNSAVIVNMEFWHGPESGGRRWSQTIADIVFSVHVLPVEQRANSIHPGQEVAFIRYSASTVFFDRMSAIPLEYLMNTTFKQFEVINCSGERIVSLENIEIIEVGKRTGASAIRYILEIFDPEAVEGSNASYAMEAQGQPPPKFACGGVFRLYNILTCFGK